MLQKKMLKRLVLLISIIFFILTIFNCKKSSSESTPGEASESSAANVNLEDLSEGVNLTPEDIKKIQTKYKTTVDASKDVDIFVKERNYKLLKYLLDDQANWGVRKAAIDGLSKIKTTKAMSMIVNSIKNDYTPATLVSAIEIIDRNCYKKAKDYVQAKIKRLEKENADAIKPNGNLEGFYVAAKAFLKKVETCTEAKLEDDGTVEEKEILPEVETKPEEKKAEEKKVEAKPEEKKAQDKKGK